MATSSSTVLWRGALPEMLRILIGTAIAFGVFFTISELVAYRRTGRLEDLVIAIVATAITVAMGYYLKNLKRFVG